MEAFRMLTTHLSACNGNTHFASKGSAGLIDSFGLSHLPELKNVPPHRFLMMDGPVIDKGAGRGMFQAMPTGCTFVSKLVFVPWTLHTVPTPA